MADNKGRIVFIEHYLMNHTDEEQPIRTDDLIAVLSQNGFSANRNTIRDDIAALREQGVAVASVRVGNAKGYYIKGRPFKTTELKTLIDAVSSSQFISERNSKALIYQLALLAPERYREDLYATAYTSDRVKTDNPAAFATLDKIYKAVQAKKKISFQYVDYLPTKEAVLRHKRKRYVASPHVLLWADGRYYAPSYDEEKEKIVPYRVDRMRSVSILDQAAFFPLPFDPVA